MWHMCLPISECKIAKIALIFAYGIELPFHWTFWKNCEHTMFQWVLYERINAQNKSLSSHLGNFLLWIL